MSKATLGGGGGRGEFVVTKLAGLSRLACRVCDKLSATAWGRQDANMTYAHRVPPDLVHDFSSSLAVC